MKYLWFYNAVRYQKDVDKHTIKTLIRLLFEAQSDLSWHCLLTILSQYNVTQLDCRVPDKRDHYDNSEIIFLLSQ